MAPPKANVTSEMIVIGSGPGGSVCALDLAQAGCEVLVLEEGLKTHDEGPRFDMVDLVEKYRNRGLTLALGSQKINYVEARTSGGGSEINSGLYHRLPDEVAESWSKHYGIRDFDSRSLTPYFERVEELLDIGHHGPIAIPSAKLEEGARRLGWKCVHVPRWRYYNEERSRWGSNTMSRTLLPSAEAEGAKILCGIRCQKVCRHGKHWFVFAFDQRKRENVVFKARYLFLAGGAIQTPFLLQKSGLRRFVGKRLRMHPTIKVVAEFEDPVNTDPMNVPTHQVKEFSPQMSFGGSVNTKAHIAVALQPYLYKQPELIDRWSHFATYYSMTLPQGYGSVSALPFLEEPLVRYSLTKNDLQNLRVGCSRLAETLGASGAKKIYLCSAGLPPLSPRDLSQQVLSFSSKKMDLMTIHIMGSCPMGEISGCPVNSFGQVRGQENLFVSDASLFPSAIGVNPQGSIMALAMRNTQHFLQSIA